MSDVTIGAKLQVDTGNTAESVKNIKTQLREATEELQTLQGQFGALSPEALNAARRVAELRDSIQEASEVADLFDPGNKFVTVANAASFAATSFGAVQGALNLVGVEGEAAAEQMAKLQSIMAVADGFSVIADGKKVFDQLSTAISQSTTLMKVNDVTTKAASVTMKLFGGSVDTTSASFKFLKGAIAATGIGLLVVAISEAVSWFNQLTSAAEEAAEAEKKALEARRDANKSYIDGATEFVNSREKLDIAAAKAAGKSEAEITQIRIKAQQARIKTLKEGEAEEGEVRKASIDLQVMQYEEVARVKEEADKQAKEAADKAAAAAKQAAAESKRRADEEAKAAQQRVDAAKKEIEELRRLNEQGAAGGGMQGDITKLSQEYQDKLKIIQDGGQSAMELNIWWEQQIAAIRKKYRDEEIAEAIKKRDESIRIAEEEAQKKAELQQKQTDAVIAAIRAVPQEEQRSFEERRQLLDDSAAVILANTQLTNEQRNALEQAYSNARKDIDEREVESKQATMGAISGLAAAATEIAGRQTASGKALAVAATTIDTYLAAQKAYTSQFLPVPDPSSPVRGGIAAAAAVLSGLARVRGILSVSVPGGGGVGSSMPTMAAPVTPQIPQATRTALDADSINAVGNAAAGRAYVLDSDVQNSRERAERINRAARLG